MRRAAAVSNSLKPHCVSWNGNPVSRRISRLKTRPICSRKGDWWTPMSDRSRARLPMAQAAPSRSAALHSVSSSSMGALKSASLNSAHSPWASRMPWRTEYPLPRFPGLRRTRAPAEAATAAVPSLEPSSTTTISENSHAPVARYPRIVARVEGSRFSSLKAGMIMDIDRRNRSFIIAGLRRRNAA